MNQGDGAGRNRLAVLADNFAPDAVVLLYLLGSGISLIPLKSFEFSKACLVDLQISKEICEDIVHRSKVKGHEQDFSQVEKLFTSVEVWIEVVKNAAPACLILLTGSFSDITGRRKFFILFPVILDIISYLCLLFVEFDFYGSGLVIVGLIRCLPGFSGGSSVFLMAIFSHISDVTDETSRTSRIGRLTVSVLAYQPLAYLITLMVVVPGKTYPAVLSSLALFTLSAAAGIFFLKDKNPKPIPERPLIAFFNPGVIKETFKFIVRKRPNNLKKILLLIGVINILSTGAVSGESKIVYQYLKRTFSLEDTTMAYYFIYALVMLFLGSALMVNVFIKKYNLEDYKVGLISNINKLAVNAGYAFAKSTTVLYIVTLFELFTGCATIGTRSIASKAVDKEELGKLFSLLGLLDLITPLLFTVIYGYCYTYTSEKFTGAVFLLSYLFIIPAAALFVYTNYINKRIADESTNKMESDEQINGTLSIAQEPTIGEINKSFEVSEETDKNLEDIRL